MPPRTKKRKGAKETEEELLIDERLTELFFKYRSNDSSDEDTETSAGMFEDEDQKIKLKDVEKVVREVNVVEWDPSVLVLLDECERENNRVNVDKIKIIILTLMTLKRQIDDIEYLFKTFSDIETNKITPESLARALKHLNIRESSDKISLLLAFAHEQSLLQLILSEQTTGQSMSVFADKSGVTFDEFKRTFIKSAFLANK